MDLTHYIFTETEKTLALIFLALLSVKVVGSLREREAGRNALRWAWVRGGLYAAIVALSMTGAYGLGVDLAAGFRAFSSMNDMRHMRFVRGYVNASRAVQLRPNEAEYWRALSISKFFLHQYASALADETAYRSLNGELDQEAAIRYAYCHYALGQYDQVFPLMEPVIQENRGYLLPYYVEAFTYTAQKKYAHAQERYQDVLRFDPTLVEAVDGLAHVHFLMGDIGGALEVLDATSKVNFPPETRKHFDDLKAFYDQ